MVEQLELDIRIELQDFMRFQFWTVRKKIFPTIIMLASCFIIMLALVLFEIISLEISTFWLPLLILIVFYLILFISIYSNGKKVYEDDKLLQKEKKYIFSTTGFQLSNSNGASQFVWEEMYTHSESKHNILIYCSPLKAFIIPKRFLNNQQIDILKGILQSSVTSKDTKRFLSKATMLRFLVVILLIPGVILINSGNRNLDKCFENGYQKLIKGDYEAAIVEYDKAIAEAPSNSIAFAYRAYCKGMLTNYTGMLEDCSKAIALDEKNAVAYNYSAYAKNMLGDSAGACADLHKALELDNEVKHTIEGFAADYCK